MKTLTDFALKEEYKCLQSVGDKLVKIGSLIDWKPFSIIFEYIYFNKTVSEGRPEADLLLCLKCLFYNNGMVFLTLKLRKKWIDRTQFSNSLEILKSNKHQPAQKPSHLLSFPLYFGKNKIYIPYGRLPQPAPQAGE